MGLDLIDCAFIYSQAGRRHKRLSVAELTEARILAFYALVKAPEDRGRKTRVLDLSAEFHLRAVAAPVYAVLDDYDALIAYDLEKHQRFFTGDLSASNIESTKFDEILEKSARCGVS